MCYKSCGCNCCYRPFRKFRVGDRVRTRLGYFARVDGFVGRGSGLVRVMFPSGNMKNVHWSALRFA